MTIEYTPEHEVVGTLNETPPEPVKRKRKPAAKKRTRKGKSKK